MIRSATAPLPGPEAEQAVIAAMLMDTDAILRAGEHVDDTMFYDERHRRIFRAMIAHLAAQRSRGPGDARQRAAAPRRARRVRRQGVHRRADRRGAHRGQRRVPREDREGKGAAAPARSRPPPTIITEAFQGRATAEELLDDAEQQIFQVSQQRGLQGFTRVKELMWPTMERIEALQRGGKTITGVASGFTDLDELTSGFQPSDLVIVAARPSMGKTALVLNIAQYAAIEKNVPVALFSLEMSKESLVQRMLTAEGRVDAQKMRKGMLRDEDYSRLARAAGILSGAPIWIDDSAGIYAARDPLEGASSQGRSGHRHGRRRLSAAHSGTRELREPAAGDQPDLALAQGAREGARGAGDRALAALARARAARGRPSPAALRPPRVGRHRAGRATS